MLFSIVTLGLGAPFTFLIAALKDVVKLWVLAMYCAVEGCIVSCNTFLDGSSDWQGVYGYVLIALTIVSATHTGLLDNDKFRIGK